MMTMQVPAFLSPNVGGFIERMRQHVVQKFRGTGLCRYINKVSQGDDY